MTVSALLPLSFTSYFDPTTGAPVQANLFVYQTGTLDLVTVYTDAGLSIPHPVPVMSSGYGRLPPIWVGEIGNVRVRAFDQYSQLIEDVDGIPTASAEGAGPDPTPPDPQAALVTGDLVPAFTNALARPGFVFANGTRIGPTSAGAVANGRANDDTHDLFLLLWQQDNTSGNLLEVLPSRGASAEGDWIAGNKAIATPDLRGRVPVGMDGMGTAAAGRLAGITFAGGAADILGAYGGLATATLTEAQMPAHTHAGSGTTTGENVGHTHTVSMTTGAQSANHYHFSNGYVDYDGEHYHGMTYASTGLATGGAAMRVGGARNANDASTLNAGVHRHTITNLLSGTESANHTHMVNGTTSDRSVAHTHTYSFTSTSKGSGAAHENLQPSFLVTWYLKL